MSTGTVQPSASLGLTFVDPVQFGDWWRDGAARNFNHLSALGAQKFTRQLWDMPEFHDALVEGLQRQDS